MDDVSDRINGERRIAHVQYRSVVVLIHSDYEIVVIRHDHPFGFERILGNGVIPGPLPEFRQEVDVFDIVAVVLEAVGHLVFDVLVEDETVYPRSRIGWREGGSLFGGGGGTLVTLLDAAHLLGIAVVVRERFVDVRDIQVEALGHPPGNESPLLDAGTYVADGDPTPLDVGFVVDRRLLARNDPVLLGCHRIAIGPGST
jgi:hypothetical protein